MLVRVSLRTADETGLTTEMLVPPLLFDGLSDSLLTKDVDACSEVRSLSDCIISDVTPFRLSMLRCAVCG